MIQNLAQERAKDAYSKIEELFHLGDYGNYESYVKSLPATILTSGLGQAAAMLKASAKIGKSKRTNDNRAYEKLYHHLSSWLCGGSSQHSPYPEDQDLLEAIINQDESHYLHAQGEALAYLEWLKKFAEARLADQETQMLDHVNQTKD